MVGKDLEDAVDFEESDPDLRNPEEVECFFQFCTWGDGVVVSDTADAEDDGRAGSAQKKSLGLNNLGDEDTLSELDIFSEKRL